MKSILRALVMTGVLGIGAVGAQAQARVFVGVRAPIVTAVVPACPGVAYVWTPGYYAGAAWFPGRWIYRGYDRGYIGPRVAYRGTYHAYDRGRDFRGRR
jgi:hypothetical protein